MTTGEQGDEEQTRRVRVRTVGQSPYGTDYRIMDLPEEVAGQWDDEQWHSSPPGV